MGLRIVYGRASSGKTERCFREIEERLKEGSAEELVLLVPDQIAMAEERAAVKRFGAVGINGIEVFNFRWYYEKLAATEGGRDRQELTNVGRTMVIRRILQEKGKDLKIYQKAAEKRGFVGTVEKTFREFKRYDVRGEALMTLVSKGIEEGKIDPKTMDLALLYEEYEQRLNERYLDADDRLNRLAEILRKRSEKEGITLKKDGLTNEITMPKRKYWVDGFKDFTPQELNVLSEILRAGEDLTITLCTNALSTMEEIQPNELFATAKKTFCRLEKLAEELAVPIEIIKMEGTDEHCDDRGEQCKKNSEALRFLEEEFFSEGKSVYSGDAKELEIFEARELWTELDHVARRIRALCRENQYRYGDISVVTADLENYGRFIENVFQQYEIPVFLDQKKKLANHPLITVATGVFAVLDSGWSYESVFRLLKSGYWGLSTEEVDIFENFCLKYGLWGENLRVKQRWDRFLRGLKAEKNGKEDIQRMGNLREIAIGDLQEYAEAWKGKHPGKALVRSFFELLEEKAVPDKLLEETERFLEAGDENNAALQERAWIGFLDVLDQIAEAIGDDLMDLEELGELIQLGFLELRAGMAPASADQVLVGDLDRSRHHKVKALFVLGVNEDSFPANVPTVAVISDRERKYLEEKGCRLAPDTPSAIFEKEYLVYRTFSAPEERLFLSYTAADLAGNGKRPARVIGELREFFPKLRFFSELKAEENPLDLISAPGPTLGKVFDRLAEKKSLGPELEAAKVWFENDEKWADRTGRLKVGLSYTTQTEGIHGDALKYMSGGDMFSSVSRLESYGKCPFSWFIEGALRAKDREVFRLNMMDIGTFLHEMVYETITAVREMGKSMGKIEDRELEKVIETVFRRKSEEGIFASKARYKYLSGRVHRVAKRSLKMINEHFRRGLFENYGNELTFGSDSKIGEAGIRLSDGSSLRLRGRIDRLDLYRKDGFAYCRIVDYKTGSKTMSLSDVYHGLELQLLGYMSTLERNGVQGLSESLKPAAALYLKLDEPLLEGEKDATAEEIEKEIRKKLRMSGIALDEPEIFKALDELAESKDSSMDISGRKGLVSENQMEALCGYAEEKLRESGERIKKGDVSVSPICKDGENQCVYCAYHAVCKFDEELPENRSRKIRKLSDAVAIEKIIAAEEGRGHGEK